MNLQQKKYKNKIIYYNNIRFQSIKEYHRYIVLEATQKHGFIKELELQKKFELQEGFIDNNGKKQRPIYYIVDFFYFDTKLDCYVAEDVKSKATQKDKVYRLKSKMFMYQYPNILFKEII